jgi:serine protease DegS
VVNIYTERRVATGRSLLDNPFMPIPLGVPRQRIERSLGSGVIMRSDGYILTNNHVIEGADAVQVLLSDGRSAAAQFVGRDLATDLAALHVDLDDLSAIRVADSDTLSVGDVVLAIGNPLGFGHSVTQGIISGLGRFGLNPGTYEGFIQTDAVIHPGSSGGALVDVDGALVGISSLIYTSSDGNSLGNTGIGISLAIPSNLAEFVMNDLIRYGKVIRGWLGVQVEQLANPSAQAPGQQLLVRAVAPEGPAERAGLRSGDIITHFDDEPIDDVRLSMYEVSLLRPGDRLSITVLRDGEVEDLSAIIGTQPEAQADA